MESSVDMWTFPLVAIRIGSATAISLFALFPLAYLLTKVIIFVQPAPNMEKAPEMNFLFAGFLWFIHYVAMVALSLSETFGYLSYEMRLATSVLGVFASITMLLALGLGLWKLTDAIWEAERRNMRRKE